MNEKAFNRRGRRLVAKCDQIQCVYVHRHEIKYTCGTKNFGFSFAQYSDHGEIMARQYIDLDINSTPEKWTELENIISELIKGNTEILPKHTYND